MSVSSDGRVSEWSVKKGLAPSPLMLLKRGSEKDSADPSSTRKLGPVAAGTAPTTSTTTTSKTVVSKRTAGSALGAPGSDGILCRVTGGLCFDVFPLDSTTYLVGTEEGTVMRCSTTYTEQCMDVIHAHDGPVTRVALSPFIPQALLTASADWSVKLWNLSATPSTAPPIVFSTDTVRDAVVDVCWSPSIPTMFAAVTNDGHVQVWDTSSSAAPLIDAVARLSETQWLAKQVRARVRES